MKILQYVLVLSTMIVVVATSQTTYTSTATGNWSTMTWSPAGTPGASDNVVIGDGHTVTVDGNFTINNLTVGVTSACTLRTSQTTSASMVVNGNVLINANAVFIVRSNTLGVLTPNGGLAHTLEVKGNFTNNGASMDFRSGSAGTTLGVINLILSGNGTSTISSTTTYSSTNGDFNNITINKTSPGKVVLGSDILTNSGSGTGPTNCFSGIAFTAGIVETGSYTLVYQGSSSSNVSGASSTSYVIGNFGRGTSANSFKDFPVGDANGYRPISIYSTLGNAYTIAACIAGDANTGSSTLTGISLVSPVRYYKIGTTTNNSYYKFKVSYGADDGIVELSPNTDVRVVYSSDNRGTWTAIAQTVSPNTTITNPPSVITSDDLGAAVSVTAGNWMYVTLGSVDGATNALPVELTSFSVKKHNSQLLLSWSTATETNNAGFDVERALPVTGGVMGGGQWQKIGFVQGNGTSNTPHSYSFTDASAKGNVSYRLKQIDRDGSFQYSQTVEAAAGLTAGDYSLSQNFPNPFNPSTKISFAVKNAEQVNLSVFNALGQNVATLFNGIAVPNELYTLNFDGKNLASGIYFYSLRSASRNEVKRMVMTK